MSNEKSAARLPTTSWTFIHTGKDLPPEDYVSGLNQFITRYWRPVFAFMRREGHGIGDAADLTQDFLVRLVQRDLVHKADATRGKFRTFLFWHAKMFLADQGANRVSRQTSFERQVVSVSSLLREEDRCYEPMHHESAEDVFNKKWAADVLQRSARSARGFLPPAGTGELVCPVHGHAFSGECRGDDDSRGDRSTLLALSRPVSLCSRKDGAAVSPLPPGRGLSGSWRRCERRRRGARTDGVARTLGTPSMTDLPMSYTVSVAMESAVRAVNSTSVGPKTRTAYKRRAPWKE